MREVDVRDELDDLLGIDTDDPTQRLASDLVESDRRLLRALIDRRRALGLSQNEVGRRMGVTQPAVAAFERADADPKLSTVRRYALAIGVLVRHAVTRSIQSSSTLISSGTTSATQSAHTADKVSFHPHSSFLMDATK